MYDERADGDDAADDRADEHRALASCRGLTYEVDDRAVLAALGEVARAVLRDARASLRWSCRARTRLRLHLALLDARRVRAP